MSLGSHVELGAHWVVWGDICGFHAPSPVFLKALEWSQSALSHRVLLTTKADSGFGFIISQPCAESKAPDVIVTNLGLIFLLWRMVGIAGSPLVQKQPQVEKEQDILEFRFPPHIGKDLGVPILGPDPRCIQNRSSVPHFSSSYPFFCVGYMENSPSPRNLGKLAVGTPTGFELRQIKFYTQETDANSLLTTSFSEILALLL